MRDLAAEAEIAQGLIYYYFPSKDELLAAVLERHNLLPSLQALIDTLDDLPAREGLLRFAYGLATLLSEKRLVLRLVVRERLSPRSSMLAQVLPWREEAIARLSHYLQGRIAAGELRPHQPLIPIQLLTSSFLTLLVLEQPLEPVVE
jgi:AcrR family transcriptional regulator